MAESNETVGAEVPANTWAIVELMGHKRIAGKVSNHELGGSAFVRVDVPAPDGTYRTHLYGSAAIYGIHFVSEEIARAAAQRFDDAPIMAYELPRELRAPQLEYGSDDDDGTQF